MFKDESRPSGRKISAETVVLEKHQHRRSEGGGLRNRRWA